MVQPHPTGSAKGDAQGLPYITYLRFFAAFWVVLFHGIEQFETATILGLPEPILAVLRRGFVSVNAFFVLSGFVLSYSQRQTDIPQLRLKHFWLARFARLYPTYLAALVVAAPKFFTSIEVSNGYWITAGTTAVVLLIQAWIPSLALLWVAPAWSLSAEAFFYTVFPFLHGRLQKLPSIRWHFGGLAICWILSLALATILTANSSIDATWSAFAKYNPAIRLPEFAFGVILGQVWKRCDRRGGRLLADAWGVTCVALACIAAYAAVPKLLLHNGLLSPLFGLLVWQLALKTTCATGPPRTSALLQLLGESSYALYLVHVPVKAWVWYIAGVLNQGWTEDRGSLSLLFIVYILSSMTAAIAVHLWIEKPLRHRLMMAFGLPSRRAA